MIALGFQPGIANTRYAAIMEKDSRLVQLKSGAIRTEADIPFQLRLKKIYDELVKIIARFKPNVLLVEESYTHRNPANVLSVGQVRGAVMLAAANAGVDVDSYSSIQVKQAIVGTGKATKHQVQQMIKVLLGLKEPPKADYAEALALAICHLHSYKRSKLYDSVRLQNRS